MKSAFSLLALLMVLPIGIAHGQGYVLEFETPDGFGLGSVTSFYDPDWNWSPERLDMEGDGIPELPCHDSASGYVRFYNGAAHTLAWERRLADNGDANYFFGFFDIDADGQREAVFHDHGSGTGHVVIVDVALDTIEFELVDVFFPTILDIDADGRPELMVEYRGAGEVTQIWGAGTGGAVTEPPETRTAASAMYPNPSLGGTRIEFDVPFGDTNTTLQIFEMTGALVKELLDEPLTARRHEVVWDGLDSAGRPVASGVYLYRLSSGNSKCQGKIVVQK